MSHILNDKCKIVNNWRVAEKICLNNDKTLGIVDQNV